MTADRRAAGSVLRGKGWLAYPLVLALIAAGSWGLHRSQERTEQTVRDRFAARTALSSDFVATFASQTLAHERAVAEGSLASGADADRFEQVTAAFGFSASVLLDESGRLLAVKPAAPELLGTRLASDYAHLQAAAAGRPAVSGVVPSAARREPVVAFATPLHTAKGTRVFSGAYSVSQTPLRAYLQGISTLKGFEAFLVDADGRLIAASHDTATGATTLAVRAPQVAELLRARSHGTDALGRAVSGASVTGTPWRLVTAVPERSLFETSRQGFLRQWVVLGLLGLVALVACWLARRLFLERAALRRANARLDELAHLDGLTGVASRRRLEQQLAAQDDRLPSHEPLSVLMVDVDRFKRINDTFGHAAGDEVLRVVAARLRAAVREQDLVGRWGGEEFLVILPGTAPDAAMGVAGRVLEAVRSESVPVGTGGDELQVTVSIGCHGDARSRAEVVVQVADRALYRAKAEGRDTVRSAQQALRI